MFLVPVDVEASCHTDLAVGGRVFRGPVMCWEWHLACSRHGKRRKRRQVRKDLKRLHTANFGDTGNPPQFNPLVLRFVCRNAICMSEDSMSASHVFALRLNLSTSE
jgi:hypothetical protein